MTSTDVVRLEMFTVLDSAEFSSVEELCVITPKIIQEIFNFFERNSDGLGELSKQEKKILHESLPTFGSILILDELEVRTLVKTFDVQEIRAILSGFVYIRTELLPIVLQLNVEDFEQKNKDVYHYFTACFGLLNRLEHFLKTLLKLLAEKSLLPNQSSPCTHYWWSRDVTQEDVDDRTVINEAVHMPSNDGARAEMFSLLRSMSATEPADEFCPKIHKFLRATFNYFSSTCEGLGELNEHEALHSSMGIIVRMILTSERELWDIYMDKFNAYDIRSMLSGVVYVRVEFLPVMLEWDKSRSKRAVLVFPAMFFSIFAHVERYLFKLLKTTTFEITNENQAGSCDHFWWTQKIEPEMEIRYNIEEYVLTD